MTPSVLAVALAALQFAAAPPAPRRAAKATVDATSKLALAPGALAPLPAGEKAAWSHAPFEEGACATCHQKNDPKSPGPLSTATNELCYGCHEEFQAPGKGSARGHSTAMASCSNCHNAHNARKKMLLLADERALCLGCHGEVEKEAGSAAGVHAAVRTGATCTSCHDAHSPRGRAEAGSKKQPDADKVTHGSGMRKELPRGKRKF